jgi:hypothetical protein
MSPNRLLHYEKNRVLQLGLQLGFLITMDICNSWYLYKLNAIRQVAVVAMDTLCHIQYHIYGATHMQLYATSLQPRQIPTHIPRW